MTTGTRPRLARRVAILALAALPVLAACGGPPPESLVPASLAARTARELRGVWVSAAPERAVSKAGAVSWRRRVFDLGERTFRLRIDVYADAEARQRTLTLDFEGPYHVGDASPTVAGAVEAEFGHTAFGLTPWTADLVARVDAEGCAPAPWRIGVRQDVSARGCLGIASIADCPREYDIVSVEHDRLRFGDRVVTPCRPELRLAKLSPTDVFVRSPRSFEDEARAANGG